MLTSGTFTKQELLRSTSLTSQLRFNSGVNLMALVYWQWLITLALMGCVTCFSAIPICVSPKKKHVIHFQMVNHCSVPLIGGNEGLFWFALVRGECLSVISFLLDITRHYLHVAVLHNWPHPCQFTVSKESCLLKKKDELKKKKSFSINTECATIPLEMWAPDVSLGKLASVTNSQYFCITRRDKVSYFVL